MTIHVWRPEDDDLPNVIMPAMGRSRVETVLERLGYTFYDETANHIYLDFMR